MTKLSLHDQGDGIGECIGAIALSGIRVMGGKINSTPKQSVIEHHHGAVQNLEFVIPKHVEDPWFCRDRVPEKATVIAQDPNRLLPGAYVRALIAAHVQKI